jgi:hypothetical protein
MLIKDHGFQSDNHREQSTKQTYAKPQRKTNFGYFITWILEVVCYYST